MEGNIIEVNATALQVLGYRSGELRGQNIRIIHPEDFNEDGCKFFKSALISGSNTITMMMRSKDRKKLIPTEARIKKDFGMEKRFFSLYAGIYRNYSYRSKNFPGLLILMPL
ncbi:PAS domain-containing protein [Syntrophomonas palmitatica]|uniref:PAS domain-containing protein n=1 Tax=Syntrophomonas palmitatica TaxID=402877 RepID=UPI0006CFEDCB|nr:PAS domain-containing protein [Syntrophomonas palmitatica]